MDPQILAIINYGYLISFIILIYLAVLRIGKRYLDYKREKQPVPLLLKRDFFFLGGLGLPFLGVLFFRAFNILAVEQPWYPIWVIGSNSLAILGTLGWVYIEYFVIEK